MTDEQIIDAFRTGKDRVMQDYYQSWKEPFKAFLQKKFGMTPDKVEEVYNDSYTALYMNIRKGKLDAPMQSGLKTYLFAIGRNLALKTFRKTKTVLTDNIPETGEGPDVEKALHYAELKDKVALIMKKIGEPCKSLMQLFYIEEQDYDFIAKKLGVKSTGTLRKRKFDCLKKMKALLS